MHAQGRWVYFNRVLPINRLEFCKLSLKKEKIRYGQGDIAGQGNALSRATFEYGRDSLSVAQGLDQAASRRLEYALESLLIFASVLKEISSKAKLNQHLRTSRQKSRASSSALTMLQMGAQV
jgi:hypothetical protein